MTTNPMEAYINKELKQRAANEINDLLLDNCKSAKVVGFDGHDFSALNHISFIGCDLESLEGLPLLEEVRFVDLSENKLTSVDKLVESLPNLYHLNLCGNKFETVDQLKKLGELKNLQALDVFDCPLTEGESYREEIFAAIPSLKYLDGFNVDNEEADDLEMGGEDGEFGAEDAAGFEDELESGEEEEESLGLDYLDSSKALKDEDDSADFVANGKSKAQKRKLADNGDGVAEKKKAEEEA